MREVFLRFGGKDGGYLVVIESSVPLPYLVRKLWTSWGLSWISHSIPCTYIYKSG